MESSKRDFGYDIVRFFSTIIIVFFHFSLELHITSYKGYTNYLCTFRNGGFGIVAVALFFLLSGATLIKNNRDICISNFYKKRFFNIFPLFWICYVPLFFVRCFMEHNIT